MIYTVECHFADPSSVDRFLSPANVASAYFGEQIPYITTHQRIERRLPCLSCQAIRRQTFMHEYARN